MNERIRKLAEQAEGTKKHVPAVWQFYDHELTKFAELIVRECVSTLNDMHLWQSVNNQNYPNSWHDTVDQGIDAIKSHFGVE